ncbi:hypothetical protein Mgra_00001605 [Meloidogyne graminicola]|uniref:MARVEL domain-containing protein n=1 Tax=Meloidogyne graminicola TaxID=189291 RepID=A0A8T0A0K6_9BILA|nr:hypothetical protein Mgra_00001605 [Meloidogyne graminicola]
MESTQHYEIHNIQPERPSKHFYSRQEPDGTILTTTVETKYSREIPSRIYLKNGENIRNINRSIISYEEGSLNIKFCFEPFGVLKILEIIICLIIICLLTVVYGPGPFKGILFGQTIIMLFTGLILCLTFLILDLLMSGIASICFLIFSCLEAYYSTGAWSNNCNDIGGDGIIHNGCRLIIEWAFAAFFCFILFVLYAASTFFAAREHKYEIIEKKRLRREREN